MNGGVPGSWFLVPGSGFLGQGVEQPHAAKAGNSSPEHAVAAVCSFAESAQDRPADRPQTRNQEPGTRNRVRSVLIVRLSALGDCIHALPAIQALRAARPDLRIGWAVDDRFAPLFQGHPDVNEFHVLPRRGLAGRSWLARGTVLRELGGKLRAARFDAAVDMQGLAKSALLTLASGAPLRIGLSAAAGARELSWATYNCRPPVPVSARHVAERSLALLAPLGVPAGTVLGDPRLPVRPEAAARVEAGLEKMSLGARRFAVLNPGAGWETKLWPVEHYIELARLLQSELGLEVLVSWFGERERELAGRIGAGGVARPAVATDLQELAELLRRAALYVGSDTGPTHIAAAVGTPTVAFFGPADAVRNRPLGPRVEALTAGVECAPCWRRSGCRREIECMTAIRPEQVMAAARRLLSADNRHPAPGTRSLP